MTKRLVENLLHKELSYQIHGAAIEVRKDFGPGHKESKKLLVSLSLILVLFGGISKAEAASLYFVPADAKIGVGEVVRAELRLDSPENVNAVEGTLVFPTDLLEVKNINDGNSIISFWIARPKLENGSIVFAGAIPGGYPSLGGRLFSVDFVARKTGSPTVSIKPASALLNDGQGTPANLNLKPFSVSVVAAKTGAAPQKIEDKTPPESFVPIIASDPNLFDGKHFLVFATQDKGIGIDYYEVSETSGFWPFKPSPENWEKFDSPRLLKDQELKSWIFVKAVDKQGNERIEVLPPENVPVYQRLLTISIGVILVVVLLLVRWRKVIHK